MEFLTKEAIQKLSVAPRMERVDLPEWDGFIYVREMSAKARDAFENSTVTLDANGNLEKDLTNYRAKFVVLTACDETGKLVFSMDDARWLGERQVRTVQKIFDAAQKLNGVSETAAEELEKNSEAPAAVSSSD